MSTLSPFKSGSLYSGSVLLVDFGDNSLPGKDPLGFLQADKLCKSTDHIVAKQWQEFLAKQLEDQQHADEQFQDFLRKTDEINDLATEWQPPIFRR